MTDEPTPTTDLLKRCAEIHEWRSTGVLSGEALRDYAKRKWPDRHDTLQMAEHETVTEALALLAKWGRPAQAAEPVARLVIGKTKGGVSLTHMVVPAAYQLQEGMYALYTAHQPVARVPLTDGQIQDLLLCGNPTDEEMRLIRIGWDAAHGIGETPRTVFNCQPLSGFVGY